MLVLFYGEGRLGNQIFQYQALSSLAGSSDCILAAGLEDLRSVVETTGPQLTLVTRSRWVKRCIKYLLVPCLLRPLARTLRLIGYATEHESGHGVRRGASGQLSLRRGLLASITFVDGGYYQNADIWPHIFPATSVRLQSSLRSEARRILDRIGSEWPVFVHVRRGDYLKFSSYGVDDLTLPESFYRAAIDEMRQRLPQAHWMFVTDDPAWVEDHFADVQPRTVTSVSAALDFAVMTECVAGILSNSTFSLAAALLLPNPQLLIGPQYWFGFRVGEWLPPHIRVDHPRMLYLPAVA
ncbi:MAG TPA: alpha-1,2-fucosyltransferase [Povalibacter sp.]|nr:alpha-1,2-fucosyltransferase [Povalibacter sp.]